MRSKPIKVGNRVPSVPLEDDPDYKKLRELVSKLSPDRVQALSEYMGKEIVKEEAEE